MLVHWAATCFYSFPPHISHTTATVGLRQLWGDMLVNCALWWRGFCDEGQGLVVDALGDRRWHCSQPQFQFLQHDPGTETRDNMLLPVFADVLPLCRNSTLILTERSRVIIRVDESEVSLCSWSTVTSVSPSGWCHVLQIGAADLCEAFLPSVSVPLCPDIFQHSCSYLLIHWI